MSQRHDKVSHELCADNMTCRLEKPSVVRGMRLVISLIRLRLRTVAGDATRANALREVGMRQGLLNDLASHGRHRALKSCRVERSNGKIVVAGGQSGKCMRR